MTSQLITDADKAAGWMLRKSYKAQAAFTVYKHGWN